MTGQPLTKPCTVCGRTIEWRKKWERSWDDVRYCSEGCRRRKVQPIDHDLEVAITDLLESRARGATICPSEAARAVGASYRTEWRELMDSARMAARRLVAGGHIVITQKGQVVDPSTAKGPIRLRKC